MYWVEIPYLLTSLLNLRREVELSSYIYTSSLGDNIWRIVDKYCIETF
jgi:hypothetical protein